MNLKATFEKDDKNGNSYILVIKLVQSTPVRLKVIKTSTETVSEHSCSVIVLGQFRNCDLKFVII
jgi:hypothetical protein